MMINITWARPSLNILVHEYINIPARKKKKSAFSYSAVDMLGVRVKMCDTGDGGKIREDILYSLYYVYYIP